MTARHRTIAGDDADRLELRPRHSGVRPASSAANVAREWIRRGCAPIPVPYTQKAPKLRKWQELRIRLGEVEKYFADDPGNVGVILGVGGLVDVDLDCMEAVRVAETFLPPTATFGRSSKPRSHYLYTCAGCKTRKWKDPIDGAMLLEFRSTGAQTVVPGSVHPSGESVEWTDEQRDAYPVESTDITARCGKLAAASLLAKHWPGQGSRHDAALHLGGALVRSGWEGEAAREFVASVCSAAGCSEASKHAEAALHAERRIANGEPITGWRSLQALLGDDGEKIVRNARKWIGCDRSVCTPRPRTSRRPTISTDRELSKIVDQAIEAVARLEIFQRGGILVDLVREAEQANDKIVRPHGTPRLRATPAARLRECLTQAAEFIGYRRAQGELVESSIRPPREVVNTLMARGEWAYIRPIVGVVDWPFLRPDGSVCCEPGYDAATRIYYAGGPEVVFPEAPTKQDAVAAVNRLLALVDDFPFDGDASCSAWVATFLTLLARPAIEGPIPLTLFEAPEKGAGKTLLCDTIVVIACGKPAPRRTVPKDSAEWDKTMLGIAIGGDAVLLIDNVTGPLRSDALDAVLTGTEFRGRLLGKNEEVCLPVRTMFLVTANNPTISADLVRRSISVRLDARMETPARRTGFRHPDLLEHCRRTRAQLLADGLTILRAYVVAGRPQVPLLPMGSYEKWSQTVRAPLVWLGLADPGVTQDSLRENADGERELISTLFSAWDGALGEHATTVRALLGRLEDSSAPFRELRDAICTLMDCEPGTLPSARKLGTRLRMLKGKCVGDLLFDKKGERGENGVTWRVVRRVAQTPPDCPDSPEFESSSYEEESVTHPARTKRSQPE